MHWQYKNTTTPQTIEELRQLLLEQRQVTTPAETEAFFRPQHPERYSLAEVGLDEVAIGRAVQRIQLAAANKEKVVIFGDYDVDGVCSTAILWEALRAVGVIAQPFLPHREKHGYGLSMRSLTALLAEHSPDLLITVDNGIVAHQAFAELQRLGISTILTDHHSPEVSPGAVVGEQLAPVELFPPADIIVHSTQMCGSGVAWFLAKALSPISAATSLDLMALATIADQMPLLGINRSFVVHGMAALRQSPRVGIQALLAKGNVNPAELSTETINYVLAPRINAMGRLKHSLDALRLICTTNPDRAASLVEELNTTNTTRQELTADMIEHALEQAERWHDQHIIIVADRSYHEGVIGLLAGKLAETYSKPAIAIAIGETILKASARSIEGVNITEFIRLVRDDLLEVGGHPMAAGFAALPDKLELIQERLEILAKAQISAESLRPTLAVESALPESLVSLETAEMVAEFAPFGNGNPEPVFALAPLQITQSGTVGKDSQHLKLSLALGTGQLTALGWGKGELARELPPGTQVQLAGRLSINTWRDKRSLQVVVRDVKIYDTHNYCGWP